MDGERAFIRPAPGPQRLGKLGLRERLRDARHIDVFNSRMARLIPATALAASSLDG